MDHLEADVRAAVKGPLLDFALSRGQYGECVGIRLAREARAATTERVEAAVRYYRYHVGAKKPRQPGWLEERRIGMAIFEAELRRRKEADQGPS